MTVLYLQSQLVKIQKPTSPYREDRELTSCKNLKMFDSYYIDNPSFPFLKGSKKGDYNN
jgi:hypothetical protein